MKRTKTKILSVFLSLCMIISCMVGMSLTAGAKTAVPANGSAADDGGKYYVGFSNAKVVSGWKEDWSGHVITKLFDGKDDKICGPMNTSTGATFEFDAVEAFVPGAYYMRTADGVGSPYNLVGRNPKSWTIYGSNDKSAWTQIAAVNNDTTIGNAAYTAYKFSFDNASNTAYRYFRLVVSAKQGANGDDHDNLELSEFYMSEKPVVDYQLNINDVRVTSANTSGDGWSYNASTNTLTLSNYTFDGVGAAPPTDSTVIMYYPQSGTLNIVLEGTNTIKQGYGSSKTSWGIYSRSDFTIGGTGTLNISTKNGATRGAAIYSEKNLTIKDTCTVNATSGTVTGSQQGYGIGGGAGKTLTIGANANVTLTGPKGGTEMSVKNAVVGTGWTDTAGTAGKADIAVSESGQSLISYKKVQFPGEPVATVTVGSTTTNYADFAAAVTAWNAAANGSTLKLLKDVTTASTITVSGTKTLDLNGHGIRMTGSGSVINVSSGRTLNLYDCDTTTTHKYTIASPKANGAGLATVDDANGTKTFTGGYITGGNAVNGGGVSVIGGTLTMNGGTIIGNKASLSGGGIYIDDSSPIGQVVMNGGAVIGNTAGNGGGAGVSVINGGSSESKWNTFVMNDGEIRYNYTDCVVGGGIRIYADAKATVNGGAVTNNYSKSYGAGIGEGWLYLSGAPVIKDNYISGDKQGNINMYSGYFIVVTGELSNEEPYGVTMTNNTGVFTKSTNTSLNDASKFKSDNTAYAVGKNAAGQLLLGTPVTVTIDADNGSETTAQTIASGSVIEKPDDPTKEGYEFSGWYKGETEFNFTTAITANTALKAKWESRHKHDGIAFEPWTSTTSLPTAAGSYYLVNDVTISSTWTVPTGTTNLCLNGHGIKMTGSDSVITALNGVNLTIYDCEPDHVDDSTNRPTDPTTKAKVKGGYITGGKGKKVSSSGQMKGGGIFIDRGTVTMKGGTVIDCKIDTNVNNNHGGGGVYIGGTFNMYEGAAIVGCSIKCPNGHAWGGAVCVDSVFNMYGGRIEKNLIVAKEVTGGGVWGRDYNLLTGSSVIINNTANGVSSNYQISGNNANCPSINNLTDDADLYIYTLTMPTDTSDVRFAKNSDKDAIKHITSDRSTSAGILYCDGTKDWIYYNGEFFELTGHHTHSAGTLWLSTAAKFCTVTFDTDGGLPAPDVQEVLKGNKATAPETAPTKDGYTFGGWYDGDTKFDFGTAVTANITLKAKWTANLYVKYDKNGAESGTAPTDSTKYEPNANVTVLGNTENLVKTGYTFDGWNTKADGTGTAYAAGGTFAITADTTLYAQWKINQYTITFDAKGGSVVDAITQNYGTEVTIPDDPSKTGYTFAGWDKEIPAAMPAEDITITAQWKVNSHTVTYKVNGAVYGDVDTVEYGKALTARPAPTKTGYTFSGWSSVPKTMPDKDVVITGTFTVNTYKVKLNANGGAMPSGAITEYTYGKGASLPTELTKQGYKFAGWYTNSELTGKPVNNIGADETGDKVFYAAWDPKDITIFYDTNGGTSIEPITQAYGTELKAPSDPTRVGYTFDGWDTQIPTTIPSENLTVTAKWKINSYTISFDTQGGTKISDITGNYGTAVKAPANPKKEGYTFSGWDKEIPTEIPAEDITLTAVWTANNYTLTFDTQGGTAVQPITQAYGTAIETPDAPAKTGFTFAGWEPEIPETIPANDMTFKAIWKVNTHTLTYRVDGAVYGEVENVEYGKALTLLPEPTKKGHTFSGWSDIPTTMPNEDVVVTGSFTVNTYKVTLYTNGGALSSGAITKYTYGVGASLPTELTKTGFVFGGWYEKEDLSGTAVNNITGTDIGDKVFYAKWNINEYTIFFDTDGGSTIAPITANYDEAVTAPEDPTKEGYTFTGWDKEIPAAMPAENVTIKATWTIKKCTITFDTDGGSTISAITQDYGTEVTAPEDPTKTGYTFAGWDKAIPTTMPAENVTIKAKWTINQYTITFDTDGGTEIAAITQDYGTAVTKPDDPTKTGYTFAGWDKEIPAKMPDENVTIKAKWTINQYTITFDTDGGTAIVPITQDYGTAVKAPETPKKSGYIFKGWNPNVPATMPAKNMTITAIWGKPDYEYVSPTVFPAPSTPTIPKETEISTLKITGIQDEINANDLRWDAVPGASGYSLYIRMNGKYVYVQDLGAATASDIVLSASGKYYVSTGGDYTVYDYNEKTEKFVKTGTLKASKIGSIVKANNVTNYFMVKIKDKNGKESSKINSYNVSVKVYYKPALRLSTARKNGKSSITIEWDKVSEATTYRVYKYVNGKLKKITETSKTAVKINGTKTGKKYTFAVKALVNGKWTKVYPSDLASITSK